MYDPNGLDELIALAEFKMSSDMITAFGFDIDKNASLINMITSYFYGMLIYFILIIYVILVGNRLMVEHVNKGSMAYLLSTPHTRTRIASFQAIFFLSSIALQLLVLCIAGIVSSEASFPGLLDIKSFITLNIGMFLLFGMFSGISFLSSCIFDETKNALALGAGLPLAFIIIDILSNVDPSLNFLSNFTIISLLDSDSIISGGSFFLSFSIMTVIIGLLYFAGIRIFAKRDLSL
jgi:ABC-2 type transport system permease protein